MACYHKFKDDLDLEKLDYEPTTLIVGTFNPEWPESNYAEWFYGRTDRNYFWEVLPRLYNGKSLRDQKPEVWKAFCRSHLIAISDLVYCIKDADKDNGHHLSILETYSDASILSSFKQIERVEIVDVLFRFTSIKNVYLTRKPKNGWEKYWSPVENYCKQNGIHIQNLLTPSSYAVKQINRFKKKYPEFSFKTSGDVTFADWKEKWHSL